MALQRRLPPAKPAVKKGRFGSQLDRRRGVWKIMKYGRFGGQPERAVPGLKFSK